MKPEGYETILSTTREELEAKIKGRELWESDGRRIFDTEDGGFAAFAKPKESSPEKTA